MDADTRRARLISRGWKFPVVLDNATSGYVRAEKQLHQGPPVTLSVLRGTIDKAWEDALEQIERSEGL